MLEWLLNLDSQIYYLINTTWSNSLLDQVMPTLTDLHKVFIVQVVVFPALLIFWCYKEKKRFAPYLIGLVIAYSFTDAFNHYILKASIQRMRPPFAEQTYNLRTSPHYGYSFPSNHASNIFAAATYLSFLYPPARIYLLGFATIIAYSRVYVGVHYPFDVLVGALVGILMAFSFYNLVRALYSRHFESRGFKKWQKF
ncbi:MAG: phosphatase PAP2 family protein [Pseudobdellovibrionaceae bacterium]